MSCESPSPDLEIKREASVDLVKFWRHAAPGHQSYPECFCFQWHVWSRVWAVYIVPPTPRRIVWRLKLGTRPRIFTLFAFYQVDMAVLDVQFMKLPGWSCAASYFFITSHTLA
eukprot:1140982-Pelagomonas_calceolata.AAC.3